MKIVFYIIDYDYQDLILTINILSRIYKTLELIGFSSNKKHLGNVLAKNFNKNVFIPEYRLSKINFDYLVLIGTDYDYVQILNRLNILNIKEEKIVANKIIYIPNFTFEKYNLLRSSKPTIFPSNCFGGLISKTLNIQFYTPFINLFLNFKDFIKFLKKPYIINDDLVFVKEEYNSITKKYYPVCKIDDVEFYFNHYENFEIAKEKFYERRKRINKNNIIAISYTDSLDDLLLFDSLNYEKKICFTSFQSDIPSAYYIPVKDKRPFLNYVNDFGQGLFFCYDYWDMILYNKKTAL
ncbi:MAG: DUF1919 domain-containing protein [Desulfovibrionaceae bacterium]|nr:DUF1919 domain-containing protein [Desulfovibrionaceae bacterium]